jgi:hypothetical protein
MNGIGGRERGVSLIYRYVDEKRDVLLYLPVFRRSYGYRIGKEGILMRWHRIPMKDTTPLRCYKFKMWQERGGPTVNMTMVEQQRTSLCVVPSFVLRVLQYSYERTSGPGKDDLHTHTYIKIVYTPITFHERKKPTYQSVRRRASLHSFSNQTMVVY